jgi:ABC-type nickel/cobalt efflux system permease component RcnA
MAIIMALPWAEVSAWATAQQRDFQNAMALSLQTIKSGETAAIWTLCTATAAYGFVHALGPGHGKILLGGAAIASGATLRRMVILSLVASLAQSLSAILFIGVLLQVLQIASGDAVALTEKWLVPASYIAIAAIGCVLIVRGIKSASRLAPAKKHHEHHEHNCGCGHKHGVTLDEVKSLQSSREVAALIASIAIRPCTGALFLLVIAARFDIFMIGVLATITMGLGTALFNILTATSGVAARRLAYVGGAVSGFGLQGLSAGLHIFGGLLILGLSVIGLMPALRYAQ